MRHTADALRRTAWAALFTLLAVLPLSLFSCARNSPTEPEADLSRYPFRTVAVRGTLRVVPALREKTLRVALLPRSTVYSTEDVVGIAVLDPELPWAPPYQKVVTTGFWQRIDGLEVRVFRFELPVIAPEERNAHRSMFLVAWLDQVHNNLLDPSEICLRARKWQGDSLYFDGGAGSYVLSLVLEGDTVTWGMEDAADRLRPLEAIEPDRFVWPAWRDSVRRDREEPFGL